MSDALTDAGHDALRLSGATLTSGAAGPLGPIMVAADTTGLTFWRTGDSLGRSLPWERVLRVRVDAGDGGTTVLVATPRAVHHVWAPGADPARTADGLARVAGTVPVSFRPSGTRPTGPLPTPRTDATGPPATAAPSWFLRLRPFLTVVLALAVATMVALVLAESTGAIHLSWLGGSGGAQIPPGR